MPRARLGQHFLTDTTVASRIVDAVGITTDDLVVEIGPGTGSLTRHLVPRISEVGARLLLVEVDAGLAALQERQHGGNAAVHVVHADARDLDLEDTLGNAGLNGFKVVANLPYYAGTPIVRKFLESRITPLSMIVMLQREVVLDMAAKPGNMSLLSLAVQIYATGEVLFTVDPSAFRPRPKVQSSVIRLVPHAQPLASGATLDALFKLARVCFRGKRKQLHNSMANGLGLTVDECKALGASVRIDTQRRPATLTISEWESLAKAWLEFMADRVDS